MQKQELAETYLFPARGHTELGQFHEALVVYDKGIEEVPGYNLLRVQRRIRNRHLASENGAHE